MQYRPISPLRNIVSQQDRHIITVRAIFKEDNYCLRYNSQTKNSSLFRETLSINRDDLSKTKLTFVEIDNAEIKNTFLTALDSMTNN